MRNEKIYSRKSETPTGSCKLVSANTNRKEVYKYLASNGANRQVFSVQLNIYTDFVKQIGLLDGKVINTSLSDTEFYSINRRTKASSTNPGTALVRFQFIEIMTRLAIKRYFHCKSFE